MKIAGTLLIVFAFVIGIVPQLTQCQAMGRALELANGKTVPMKCHWTAQAALPLAASLLAIGGLTVFNRRKEVQRNLAVLGGVLGVFVALLPTALIGVCAGNEMMCNMIMKPTLLLTGILTAAVSIYVFAQAVRTSPAEKAVLEHAS